jgi:hypothetical protein
MASLGCEREIFDLKRSEPGLPRLGGGGAIRFKRKTPRDATAVSWFENSARLGWAGWRICWTNG